MNIVKELKPYFLGVIHFGVSAIIAAFLFWLLVQSGLVFIILLSKVETLTSLLVTFAASAAAALGLISYLKEGDFSKIIVGAGVFPLALTLKIMLVEYYASSNMIGILALTLPLIGYLVAIFVVTKLMR